MGADFFALRRFEAGPVPPFMPESMGGWRSRRTGHGSHVGAHNKSEQLPRGIDCKDSRCVDQTQTLELSAQLLVSGAHEIHSRIRRDRARELPPVSHVASVRDARNDV